MVVFDVSVVGGLIKVDKSGSVFKTTQKGHFLTELKIYFFLFYYV